jgi:hypothetical protein
VATCAPGNAFGDAYIDRQGERVDPVKQYQQRLDARRSAHLLTLVGETVFLAGGLIWYHADRERNLADWDYASWQQRFSREAWRFDNNEFPINFMGHAITGGGFYALPRAHGHSLWASSMYAFATSFAWEYLVEFREKISVNDLVVTQGSGMVMGEFVSKLWHYVNGLPQAATSAQRAVATTLGFPVWLKQEIYDDAIDNQGPYDSLGLSTRIGHRFEVGYRYTLHTLSHRREQRRVGTYGFYLGGRLSSIPGEGRPGRFRVFFHDADIVSMALSGASGRRARQVDFFGDLYLLGVYSQDLDATARGPATTMGLSMAYHYRLHDFEAANDRLGLMHLPGPAIDFSYRKGAFRLATRWRMSGDFAGLHSAAFRPWAKAKLQPDDRPTSILAKHNYAYGWGISTRIAAAMSAEPLHADVSLSLGSYRAINGLNRNQEAISHDVMARERHLEFSSSIGLYIPRTPVDLRIAWTRSERSSHIETVAIKQQRQSWSTSVGLRF